MEGLWDGTTDDKDADVVHELDIEDFDWDEEKNQTNIEKHGVSFQEAEEAFAQYTDIRPANRKGETRWALVGATSSGRSVLVVFTMRGKVARIMTARRHP